MRSFIYTFIFLNICLLMQAQSPNKFSFQAVIRNNSDQLIKNQGIGLRISIVQGSESGNAVFQEIFNPNPVTNQNGLVTLQIGGGIAIQGSFSTIDWAAGPYFIKTEADPSGGTNYTLVSTSPLLSIPYALLAKNVENLPSIHLDQLSDVNTSGVQAGQVVKWNGTEWTAANDNTGGGSGPSYTPGTGISIDVNNVINNTGDLSNTNEIQQLELAGNQLKLTGANTVTLPTGTTYAAGTGISLANNTITNTGDNDNDADNELQQLSISGTVLTLSQNGGSITLPSTGTGGDNWGTQVVTSDNATISGNGTPSSPIKLANQNSSNGQVLKNNGTTWVPGVDNDNQNLSVSGNQLSISNGNTVTLPIQSGDNWGSQTANVQSPMTGDGTSANPISIANGGITPTKFSTSGANVNDTYVFNGNAWVVRKPVNITTNATSGLEVLPVTGEPLTFQVNNKLWSNMTEFGEYANIQELTLGYYYNGFGAKLGSGCRYTALRPALTNEYDIGQSSFRWDKIFVNSIIGGKSEGDWLPSANGTMDLGSTTFEWDKVYANTIVGAKHEGDWLPTVNGTMDLGSSTFKWGRVYANNCGGDWIPTNNGGLDLGSNSLNWDKVYANFIVGAKCDGDWIPAVNNTMDLGSSTFEWNKLFVEELGSHTYIDGNFRPTTPNVSLLGTSTNRWAVVHAVNGMIQTSDRRLKKNIQPMSYGLKDVMNIKPVTWEWKNEKQPGTYMGFIAQDLLDIVPGAVYVPTDEDFKEYADAKAKGYAPEEPSYGIKYAELIPVLTKAIQEQQEMIDNQNKKIEALMQKIEALEKK